MSSSSKILVVDAEAELRASLTSFLAKQGYAVVETSSQEEAVRHLHAGEIDLLLAEVATPKADGLSLLKSARELEPPVPVVLMSRYGNVRLAVDAIRMGASDFLAKPFELEDLRESVARALNGSTPRSGAPATRRAARRRDQTDLIIGQGQWRDETLRVIEKVAPTRATVLLTGESGTGKELVARAIHAGSPRADKPFVPVACAALSRDLLESELFGHEKGAFTDAYFQRAGRFELADGGTLFLDEISEIPLDLQVKLLRALQEREFERVGGTRTIRVDTRILAATNRDLAAAVSRGEFREDLYYRLQVVEIHLPPLRERKDDIPLLAGHFIRKYARENGKSAARLSASALSLMKAYDWPGNVRELENAIEHAVVMADPDQSTIEAELLPARLRRTGQLLFTNGNGGALAKPLNEAIETVRRQMITEALVAARGNMVEAARLLGVSLRSLRCQVSKQGLEHLSDDGSDNGGGLDAAVDEDAA
jgi:DNA-binding NtrC family response regulator